MNKNIITLEATCDLTKELISEYDLDVVDMDFMIDDEVFSTADNDVESTKLYEKMRKGSKTQTSLVNETLYEDFFENLLSKEENADKNIIHIAFSSGLSNTYVSAKKASDKLNQKYGKQRIFCVDSLCACAGQGLLAVVARENENKFSNTQDLVEFVEKTKNNLNHCFTVDKLQYLANGGRIKPSMARIGNLFNIKPVMRMDEEGRLVVVYKVFSRKKSLVSIFNKFKESYDQNYPLVIVSHADCLDDANFVAEMINKEFGICPIVSNLGPVIGSHSGPGTLALFFVSKGGR